MLARANRVTEPEDLRSVLRRGRRVGSSSIVVHALTRSPTGPVRFGFIVSKAVGGAVARNLVRRRMRAASRDILPDVGPGTDVVVRALPGSVEVEWGTLQAEIARGVARATSGSTERRSRPTTGSSTKGGVRKDGSPG